MLNRRFGLLGFSCDEGVRRNNGRPGAVAGPAAFRGILPKIQSLDVEDFGDVECTQDNLELAQLKLGHKVFELLQQSITPLVIGGGHETAWGHFQGISKYLGQKNCGIINFDAHFDLRPLLPNNLGSSGTPFLQIAQERASKNFSFDYLVLGIQPFSNSDALFQQAKSLGVKYILAQDLTVENCHPGLDPGSRNVTSTLDSRFRGNDIRQTLENFLARHEHIYLSICLDVFAECFAPGVSAPQALGLLPHQIIPLLEFIKSSNKILAADIVELAPAYDRQDTTAKLAASLAAILTSKRDRSSTSHLS